MDSPTFPLFSGWNWQPCTFPSETHAASGSPYSAVAVRLSSQPSA